MVRRHEGRAQVAPPAGVPRQVVVGDRGREDVALDKSTPEQRQEMNWCICPVITVSQNGVSNSGHGIRGTAFLIHKDNGELVGITARHVVEGFQPGCSAALLISNGDDFWPLLVTGVESHPTEDLALFKLANGLPASATRRSLSVDRFPIGLDYAASGCHDDDWRGDGKEVTLELTYAAGHLRRFRGPAEVHGIRRANW